MNESDEAALVGPSVWNYRVIRTPQEDGCSYAIHEVHYNSPNGRINGWSADPAVVAGDDLEWVLDRMRECLSKPVLEERGNKLLEVRP